MPDSTAVHIAATLTRMEIAPGIHRIGTGTVNAYLVEESGEITIVDAGLPGYWGDLPKELAAMGRSLDDVRALVLTHAHSDHVGFAEKIRKERHVPVHVHEADAALARGETKPQNQQSGGISPLPILSFLLYAMRKGGLRVTPIVEVATFGDGATLDVPGAPRVILAPGHTAGSAALHVPSRNALLVGDALATKSVVSGRVGPQIAPFGSDPALALQSVDRLATVDAAWVLPGHGEPWTNGTQAAVAAVKQAGWPPKR
jgi:glyoxylase-like metal-dependent hydrolase (beta-lactamase superfamily II)